LIPVSGRIVRPLLVVAAMLVVGCGSPGPTGVSSSAAPVVASAPAPDPATAPSPVASDANEAAIAHAISQRQTFGLRSDEAWVRQVAADPRARIGLLDFLMLPEEEAEFETRQTDLEQLAQAVTRYAADHPAEFGGVWLDQPRHTVVAAWTANPELHRIAVLASLGTSGPLEARLVRYTERELNALTDRLFADREWYRTIDAAPMAGGAMIMDNRVDLQISSANPQAPALIRAHFGVGPAMLAITSDGTGIALQPRGTLVITVVTAEGKAPGKSDIEPSWTPDRPDGRECGEFVGYTIPPDGVLSIACAPGGWTVTLQVRAGDGWKTAGTGHVVVPAGGTANVRITLDKGAVINP
jgi:hypothetical protein